MSASLLTFPSSYPEKHEPMRRAILKALENDVDESRKLLSCRFKSRCNSILCPFCLEQDGYGRKDALYGAAQRVDSRRLRFTTLKARDTSLDALRATGQQIMKAARKTFKSLDVENYALTLETSFEHWNSDYHAHAHALVEIPTGGRSFISRDRWDDAWHDSLPAELHAVDTDGAAHVRPVRDLESTCHYLHKTPFLKLVAEREAAARMVATILETKGLRRRESRGSLAATETEQCAA